MGRRENNIKTGSSGRGKTSGDSFKGRGKGSRKNSAAGSRNFSKDDRTDFENHQHRNLHFLTAEAVLRAEAERNIMIMKNTVPKDLNGNFRHFQR